MTIQNLWQNLWQNFIYIFRCFDPKRNPKYIEDDDEFNYRKLTDNNAVPYSFVIIR